jgi:GDP-L-fucose synthase
MYLMENYAGSEIVNVGTGEDISIADLARLIARVTQFTGRLRFDRDKPDGTPRRVLDVTRLTSLGWRARIQLEDGLREVYRWYVDSIRTAAK